MEPIQPNTQNSKVLAELVAGRIEHELIKKESAAQDLLDSLKTNIVYR